MEISKILIGWYKRMGRTLPWRNSSNPYNIWVSEIILQQTRVGQGRAYYERFLKSFPDVFSLARADIGEVLKVWQGLGYYSRARNMHHTAGVIVRELGGRFPANYRSLLTLKGIGPYTAAAVSSIAFGEAIPAIDGNVKRVISRLCGIHGDIKSGSTVKDIRFILEEIIDRKEPGVFNQALMDFGALVCRPARPSCGECPLHSSCYAFQHDKTSELPVNVKSIRIKKRYFYYCIIRKDDSVCLEQRKGKDIWNLLYQFPLIESAEELSREEILRRIGEKICQGNPKTVIGRISGPVSHQLSHQQIIARFIHINGKVLPPAGGSFFIPVKNLDAYAIPRLIERYLENNPI